jgi:predicted anti-sigma-YlaC factor YlaD
MTSCEMIREKLVLYVDGALESEEKRQVDEHLSACAGCSAEADEIGRIRAWLADPEVFAPEQDLTWQLLPEKLASRAGLLQDGKRGWAGLSLAKWACVALAILPLAIGLIWTLRYQAIAPPAPAPALAAAGNEAFLARMHTAYAREATAQYLSGCHDLLLDFISADKTCVSDRYDVSSEVTRARQLLQEKQMLDAELRVPDVARAKALCDELESFLVSLSMAQECETGDAVHSMEQFIESNQLLLRINLMQSGIS